MTDRRRRSGGDLRRLGVRSLRLTLVLALAFLTSCGERSGGDRLLDCGVLESKLVGTYRLDEEATLENAMLLAEASKEKSAAILEICLERIGKLRSVTVQLLPGGRFRTWGWPDVPSAGDGTWRLSHRTLSCSLVLEGTAFSEYGYLLENGIGFSDILLQGLGEGTLELTLARE